MAASNSGCMSQRPRLLLTQAQWQRIEPHICGRRHDAGVTGKNNRRFLEAVFWIVRTGAPWRDLPGYFGLWNTAYQRFRRWCHRGVWRCVLMAMRRRNQHPVALIDSTVVRAHQHSAGAQNGQSGAIGRSRGGLSTKLHVAVTPQWYLLKLAHHGRPSRRRCLSTASTSRAGQRNPPGRSRPGVRQ